MKVVIKGYIVPSDEKEIYDYFGVDTATPLDVETAIENANGEMLDVEISTCYGGEIFSGSEMYTALKAYKGGVNITITGLAASAASIIAMAGHCEMSPTAQMMVHNVSSEQMGNYHDMNKCSERLQIANKALATAYTVKSKMSEADALEMMDKETWLTAQQAVDKGLVDKMMFSDSKLVASFGAGGMLPRSVIEKTRNALHPQPPATSDTDIFKAKLALQLEL